MRVAVEATVEDTDGKVREGVTVVGGWLLVVGEGVVVRVAVFEGTTVVSAFVVVIVLVRVIVAEGVRVAVKVGEEVGV